MFHPSNVGRFLNSYTSKWLKIAKQNAKIQIMILFVNNIANMCEKWITSALKTKNRPPSLPTLQGPTRGKKSIVLARVHSKIIGNLNFSKFHFTCTQEILRWKMAYGMMQQNSRECLAREKQEVTIGYSEGSVQRRHCCCVCFRRMVNGYTYHHNHKCCHRW
jgi:hypothetical protein